MRKKKRQCTFLSGWAGCSGFFPALSQVTQHLIPFVSIQPQDIAAHPGQYTGDMLIGWSTGAHFILKHFAVLERNYRYIVLVAPFMDFTRCASPQAIRTLRRAVTHNPAEALKSFWQQAQVPVQYHDFSVHSATALAQGLTFLLNSTAKLPATGEKKQFLSDKTFLVYGRTDAVVPASAWRPLADVLPEHACTGVDSGHFVAETLLAEVIYEKTGLVLV